MIVLTVAQACELARIAGRYGPVAVRPLKGGAVVVALDHRRAQRPTVALALAADGRALTRRRLDPAPEPEADDPDWREEAA